MVEIDFDPRAVENVALGDRACFAEGSSSLGFSASTLGTRSVAKKSETVWWKESRRNLATSIWITRSASEALLASLRRQLSNFVKQEETSAAHPIVPSKSARFENNTIKREARAKFVYQYTSIQSYRSKYLTWSRAQCSKRASRRHKNWNPLGKFRQSACDNGRACTSSIASSITLQILHQIWLNSSSNRGRFSSNAKASQKRKVHLSLERSKRRSSFAAPTAKLRCTHCQNSTLKYFPVYPTCVYELLTSRSLTTLWQLQPQVWCVYMWPKVTAI